MALFLNGRIIEYTNQVIYEADFLRSNLYNMVGVAKLAETILGNGINNATLAYGLPCVPVSPPGLSVVVGVGSMYSFEFLDSSPYGVLPADVNPNHQLYKQGVNFDPVTLVTPAPTIIGDSVIHLVQATFQEIDENNVSRPYFNPASTPTNPLPPIYENNYDTRAALVNITLKQGVQSSSPVAPTPDAGYTGLYYVAVTYGQTTIISGDITKVSTVEGQPFVTEGLLNKVSSGTIAAGYVSILNQQKNTYIYGNDVGSLNTIVVNPTNAYPTYVAGMVIDVLISNTITGASTLNISGNGSVAIEVETIFGFRATVGGEMRAGGISQFKYNGSIFQLINPLKSMSLYSKVAFSPTTTQSLSASTLVSPTKILYPNPITDLLNWWDAANNRFIPTIQGKFKINAILSMFSPSAMLNETSGINLYLNGYIYAGLSQVALGSAILGGCATITLNGSTDYVEIFAGATGSITVGDNATYFIGGASANNYFEIEYDGN